MNTTEILKHIHSMIIAYRTETGLGNNEFARLADLEKTALKSIEDVKVTDKGKIRTIDLLTLLKIFNAHPALKERILNYLRGNTEKKPTPVQGTGDIDVLGSEEVRKFTRHRIYQLEQDIRYRDDLIDGLKRKLSQAGIPYDGEHDLTIKNL